MKPLWKELCKIVVFMEEWNALGILTTIPDLGSVRIRALIKFFGSASAALTANANEIALLPGFNAKIVANWSEHIQGALWEKNLNLAERLGIKIIYYNQTAYPKSLLTIPDYPLILYVYGDLQQKDQKNIAIVGTREPSQFSYKKAYQIGFELALADYTIISGLAAGIDTAAHCGALQAGRTIAVLGSGLAHLYPKENKSLAAIIAQNGAVISEFPIMTPPDRLKFPQRNRIISGMSMGTLLVEGSLKSGAMIAVEKAQMYKRPIFALAAQNDDVQFEANHYLTRTQQAQQVTSSKDLIDYFSDSIYHPVTAQPKKQLAIATTIF